MMLLVDTKVDVKYKDGGVIMEKIPRAVFTEEFKEEAVKMVTEGGLSISKTALRLSIPKSTLAYWIKIAKEGKPSATSKKRTSVTQEQMELARLKA